MRENIYCPLTSFFPSYPCPCPTSCCPHLELSVPLQSQTLQQLRLREDGTASNQDAGATRAPAERRCWGFGLPAPKRWVASPGQGRRQGRRQQRHLTSSRRCQTLSGAAALKPPALRRLRPQACPRMPSPQGRPSLAASRQPATRVVLGRQRLRSPSKPRERFCQLEQNVRGRAYLCVCVCARGGGGILSDVHFQPNRNTDSWGFKEMEGSTSLRRTVGMVYGGLYCSRVTCSGQPLVSMAA